MNVDDILQKVADRLMDGRGRSAPTPLSASCFYRHPESQLACAVGVLIKDEEYDPAIEGKNVVHIYLPERLEPHRQLLRDLQAIHDPAWNWDLDAKVLNRNGINRFNSISQQLGSTVRILDHDC